MKTIKGIFFSLFSSWIKLRYKRIILEENVRIYPSTSFSFLYCNNTGKISVGSESIIGSFDKTYRMGWFHPTRLSILAPDASIVIGKSTYLNCVNICASNSITIGSYCHFASGVQIVDYNGHLIYKYNRKDRDEGSPITIGNNVWIGLNAIVLKGTEIGDNSVVAAGSVVKGSFPPFSLIGGNPAKLIKILDKDRFS